MPIETIEELLRKRAAELGVTDIGFCKVEDGPLPYAISLVVRLSDAILDEIDTAPTHCYFHHYRTVNTFLDQSMLRLGFLLQEKGHAFYPIGASQSIPNGVDGFSARYSHKKCAVLAGLGFIGKSNLFLHHTYGPRVRLGTLFTDCPFPGENATQISKCGNCSVCAQKCPALALKNREYTCDLQTRDILDPAACSQYMKKNFQQIGRGAVCGICVKHCPYPLKQGQKSR